MIEPKKVQFNITNETAEETSINLFNVNTLLDIPTSTSYSASNQATISSANLINSVLNPLNGDVFAYSNDEDIVSIYDSSGNLIDTLTSIGSIGSGNRNSIIYIPFYNYIVVNTDLGLYIIDADTYTLLRFAPITTDFYDSTTPNILEYDEFSGILYVSSDSLGSVFTLNFTNLGALYLSSNSRDMIDSFNISNTLALSKATKQELRYSEVSNQNYLQVLNPESNSYLAGDINTSFNSFFYGVGFNGSVFAMSIQTDGKLLVGGNFSTYNQNDVNRIIRLNSDGSIDTSFNVGSGFNSSVRFITIQSDGKILVGGDFSSYQGISANNIIRLNTNGSIDTTFVYGIAFNSSPNIVRCAYLQSDDKILVGGDFAQYQGVVVNNLVRINTDGSIDNSFITGVGFNDNIYDIQIQPDNKIIVVGAFTTYKGVNSNRIIRLNTDASKDTSFIIGSGFNNVVYSVELQSDGKIIAGGDFTAYNSVFINRIIRLNTTGLIDVSFQYAIGSGFDNLIFQLKIQDDDKIYVVGNFNTYNNTQAIRFIRLSKNGFLDNSFITGSGFDSIGYSAVIRISNNTIYVGGSFTQYKNVLAGKITNIYTESSSQFTDIVGSQLDTSFNVNSGFGGANVSCIVVNQNGFIYVSGSFTSYMTSYFVNYFICLNSDGSINTSFNMGTGFNGGGITNTITLQSGLTDKIIVGGYFSSYNGVSANRIVRLNADGSIDNTFLVGTGFVGGFVYKIIIQDDDKILVAGFFSSYQGTSANNIIRLNSDGSIDGSFIYGTGFNDYPRDVALQSDGKIILTGNFTTYNGTSINRILRLNSNGSIDATFNVGTGFNFNGNTITIQSDGKILVGGSFTSYNGTGINRIVRLNTNGSIDNSFVVGTAFNNTVFDIYIDNNNNIICGGNFTTYKGISRRYIVAINQDGSIIDNLFFTTSLFSSLCNVITQNNDNKYLCGGSFTSYNNISRGSIAQIESETIYTDLVIAGKLKNSFDSGIGFAPTSTAINYSIQQQTDNKILIGGIFTSYNGVSANCIVRLNTNGSIDGTFSYGTGFAITTGIPRVYSVCIQTDGKILVGGLFTSYNGTSAGSIIRLNSNGSIDGTFIYGTGFGFFNVYVITQQIDGKILVGGDFPSYNGTSANKIIRLNQNGSVDSSFVYGTAFTSSGSSVQSLKQQLADFKILVGGSFSIYNGTSAEGIIRLNSDGSIDGTFSYGSGLSSGAFVYTIAIQGEKILIGGTFSSYNGTSVYTPVIRLNTNGTLDTTFLIGTNIYPASNGLKVIVQSDYKIIVSTAYTYNGQENFFINRLNIDGSLDSSFCQNSGIMNGSARDLLILNDGSLLAVGNFLSYQFTVTNKIVNINLDNVFLSSKPSYLSVINGNLFGVDSNNKKTIFSYDTNNNYFNQNITNFNPIYGSVYGYTFNTSSNKLLIAGTGDSSILFNLLELNLSTYQVEKTYSLDNIFIASQVGLITSLNYINNINQIVITSEKYVTFINATTFATIFQINNLDLGINNPIFETLYSSIDNKLIVNCSSDLGSEFYFIDCNDYSTSGFINISEKTSFGCFCELNNSFYYPVNGSVYVISSSSESITTSIVITGSIFNENQPAFSSFNNLIYVGTSLESLAIISYINPLTNTIVYVDTNIGSYFIEILSITYNSEDNFMYLSGYGQSQQLLKLSCVNPLSETPTYNYINSISSTFDSTLGSFQGMCTSSLNGYTYISSTSQDLISVFNNSNILVTTISISNPHWLFYVESLNFVYVICDDNIRLVDCTTFSVSIMEINFGESIGWLAFNENDNKVYITGQTNSNLVLWVVENDLSSYDTYINNSVNITYTTSRIVYNPTNNLMYISGLINSSELITFNCSTLSFTNLSNIGQIGSNSNLIYNQNNNCLYSVGSNINTIEVFDCVTETIILSTYYSGDLVNSNYNLTSVVLTNNNILVFTQNDGSINFLTFFDCSTNKILYSSLVKSSYTSVQANNFSGYINGLTYNPINNKLICYLGQNYNTGEFSYLESLVTISATNTYYNDISISYSSGGVNYISNMNSLSGIYWNQQGSNNPVTYYSSTTQNINKIIYNIINYCIYGNIENQSEFIVINTQNSSVVTTIPINIEGVVNDIAYNYLDNLLGVGSSTIVTPPTTSNGTFVVINMDNNSVNQTLTTYNNYGINFLNFNPILNSFSYGGVINSSYITEFLISSSYVISGGSVDYNFFVQGLNDNPKIIDQIDLIIPQEYSKNPINLQYKDANGISTLKPFFPNVEIDSFQKATNRSFVNFGKEYIMNINTEIVDFKLPPLSTIIFIITYQEFIKANLLDVEVYDEENKAKYLIKQNFNSGNVSAEKYWGSQSMPENFELSSVGWLSELKQKFEKVELLQQDLPKLENGTPEIRLVYKDLFGFKNEVKKRNISITEPLNQEAKPLKLTTKKEPLKPKIKKSVVSLKNKKQTEVKLSTKKQSVKPKTKKKKWLKVINIESEIENSNIWKKVSNEIL